MSNTFVKSTYIDGASVEVWLVESWRGSYYHATAKKGKYTAVNTGHDADACASTAAACVDIKIDADRKRKADRNVKVDIPSPFIDPKGWLIDPKEDAEDYKKHFTGLPPRAELSPEAKNAGIKAVLIFVMFLLVVAWFITSLPN